MTEKKSYQFRALLRKTLSYQKRQLLTNICCVGCCPFLMVCICGIISLSVGALLASIQEVEYFRYCSNLNASDPITFLPAAILEPFVDEDGKEQIRKLVNYHSDGPCVQWFGDKPPVAYPYNPGPQIDNCSAIYNPLVCPLEASTNSPTPLLGWLPDVTSIPETAGIVFATLLSEQINEWLLVSSAQGVDPGRKEQGSPRPLFPPHGTYSPGSSTGLLGNFSTRLYTHANIPELIAANVTFEERPYFEKVDNGAGDFSDVNDRILEILDKAYEEINSLPDLLSDASAEDKAEYAKRINEIIKTIPQGALLVEKISEDEVAYTLQVGTNRRISFLSSSPDATGRSLNGSLVFSPFPAEGVRRATTHSRLVQAIISSIQALAGYSITAGLRIFPENISTEFVLPVGSFTGEILYPFGVSFLLPVFVVSLVKEKEDRIMIMMRMNGMKPAAYYLTEYIHFYSLHVLSTIVFIVTGVIFRLNFFTLTDPGAYILLFFIWGHTQIAMAIFLSTLFNKSRVALIMVFCLVLAGVVINVSLGFLLVETPIAYLIYPPFAFYRALSIFNQRSFTAEVPDYRMSMMVPGDDVFNCVMALIIETILLFLIGAYLNMVLPSEFGIQRPWHFVVTDPIKWIKKRRSGGAKKGGNVSEVKVQQIDEGGEDHFGEDEDVHAERLRVYNNEFPADSPVIINDIRKIYPNGKLAIKSVSLAIDNNSVFGLLGPNGAGKTSLISILTGLYPPTSGSATLAGFDVVTEMRSIYLNIGVCPQHDILWDDLTVEEHLLFYARIKGVPPKEEAAAVMKAMETVSLQKFKDRLSKGLSGGEKRRLSIAIALMGDGKVVFLDEPTTGLDPEVRRLIWDIINNAKTGRTIILTTHSMEEAEVLCQRIGIMARGTLRCVGPQVRLKKKYGSGFKISFSCLPEDQDRASRYIESLLGRDFKKRDSFVGNVSYEFQAAEIAPLFKEVGLNKDKYGIKFWGISQTTLEEVFLQIIGEDDAEAS